MPVSKDEILQALARGYCDERNESKILDHDLITSMADEVMKVLQSMKEKDV
jgi:hypothetical protein